MSALRFRYGPAKPGKRGLLFQRAPQQIAQTRGAMTNEIVFGLNAGCHDTCF
jgi:hypothetical protein